MMAPSGHRRRAGGSNRFIGILLAAGLMGLLVLVGLDRMRDRDPAAAFTFKPDPPVIEEAGASPAGGEAGHPEAGIPGIEASAGPAIGDPGRELQRARRTREEARIRYEAARMDVAEAQAGMLRSERDVEELERFIEELEARGEDPVDHAEEGMERFMPAFEAYEVAIDRLERAEEKAAIARLEFLGAEQRLRAAQRHAGSPPPR